MEEQAGQDNFLTKKEKRELAKEQKWEEGERQHFKSKFKKFGIWILVIGVLGGGGYWLYKEATKPLPGQEVADLGQEHVTDISSVNYNSDPPTSGPHFAVWAKKGTYDRVISDGHLIHSLEHGYIVISYDCTKKISNLQPALLRKALLAGNSQFSTPVVLAHETDEPHEEPQPEADRPTDDATKSSETKPLTKLRIQPKGAMSWFTPEDAPPAEVELPKEFREAECDRLVEDLSSLLKDFQRVIIVPRPNMDTLIAIAAWGKIEKIDNLDLERIKTFAKAFHNRGPEQTSE